MAKSSDSNNLRRRATSVEVAQRAGVSQSTVSRVFNAQHTVSDATIRKVMQIAQEIGYQPNPLASSMITHRTHMVGIVMADMGSQFYPYVLHKFTRRLHSLNKRVLLFSAEPEQDVDDVLREVLRYQVDGVIVTNVNLTSTMVNECERLGTPLLLFNRYARGARATAVCCDNIGGGAVAADALLDGGHTQLGYLAGPQNTSTNAEREQGFTERLRERGQRLSLREQSDYTYESGFAAARRLLERSDRPDALFCASDIIALGALDAARSLGISVPEQLSIIGFDDIPTASWEGYALTTVRQPTDAMIDLSVRSLIERIDNPGLTPITSFLPGELVWRRTARQPLQ